MDTFVLTPISHIITVCSLICHEECKKAAFLCPPKVNDQQPSYDVSVEKKKM